MLFNLLKYIRPVWYFNLKPRKNFYYFPSQQDLITQGFELKEGYQKARKDKRFGLLGMQERVRMMDGTIKINSNLQEGTKIFIEIPVDNADDNK